MITFDKGLNQIFLNENTFYVLNVTAFDIKDQNDTYYDAEMIHAIFLATLHDEFSIVLTTEQFIHNLTK
ncbi:hypothetical protein PGC35_07220 [Psychrobacillus sp. PGGUH221]|uniref:hypothetical protein n=1 Tax=Psychrobacillus sp. PGGUH221 TaxID=3020058 RepID=UPI0035C6694A